MHSVAGALGQPVLLACLEAWRPCACCLGRSHLSAGVALPPLRASGQRAAHQPLVVRLRTSEHGVRLNQHAVVGTITAYHRSGNALAGTWSCSVGWHHSHVALDAGAGVDLTIARRTSNVHCFSNRQTVAADRRGDGGEAGGEAAALGGPVRRGGGRGEARGGERPAARGDGQGRERAAGHGGAHDGLAGDLHGAGALGPAAAGRAGLLGARAVQRDAVTALRTA
mmetsp:Transcript_37574/g.108267  ORF Transcript_37574/g.108267 Transcript_37574/m.108267 type:complete len:225 (-) Transcript_37574:99-773(-)